MISITILKVFHEGDEARKVLPYVLGCDAFGVEHACLTAPAAEATEARWKQLLAMDLSRSAFWKELERSGGTRNGGRDKGYADTLTDYLYRNRRPLYHLERMTPEESAQTAQLFEDAESLYWQGIDLLLAGNDRGPAWCYKGMQMKVESYNIRDRHMATTIEGLEESLRTFWPCLARKETIRYAAIVGRKHQPEQFTTTPLTIVDLPPRHVSAEGAIHYEAERLVQEGASQEQVTHVLRRLRNKP